MRIRVYLLLIIVFCSSKFSLGQDMTVGFNYLEQGKFAQAEVFFENVLKAYPENKTAKLCFARATGLSGKPSKALALLDDLGEKYPEDFEIRLNYAEALLWNKAFAKAESYYIELLDIDNENFPAVLGYANTLSSLKKYKKALEFVDKALEIDPANYNAMVSKKYIQLGLANQYLKEKQYQESVRVLENNLTLFPMDNETLLSLANTHIISGTHLSAKDVYLQLNRTDEERIQSKIGLSLIEHLLEHDKNALGESRQALNILKRVSNPKLQVQGEERYAQALIWNQLYRDAENYLDSLTILYPKQNWVYGLHAMLETYKRDFNKSVDFYTLMLDQDSSSFDGNLGLANAYKAIRRYDDAFKMAQKTLIYHENQKDALNFIEGLEEMFYPNLATVLSYSFDNGDNESYAISNKVTYPYTSKLEFNGLYRYRETSNDVTNFEANTHLMGVGVGYQLKHFIKLNAEVGFNVASIDTQQYNQFLTRIAFDIVPAKLQSLTLGYAKELEDFNAELIGRRITKDIVFLNHNLNTNFKLGWFNQYYYTSQNDGNTRHLYFTSLYYNLFKKPTTKVGFNYQYITFEKQLPTIYFSPEEFKMVEVFGEVLKDYRTIEGKGCFYGLNAAVGYQYIEDESRQETYRVRFDLGYQMSKMFLGSLYFQKSNIASGNSGGFSYTELGLKLRWVLSKRSVFKHIKNED